MDLGARDKAPQRDELTVGHKLPPHPSPPGPGPRSEFQGQPLWWFSVYFQETVYAFRSFYVVYTFVYPLPFFFFFT